MLGYAGRGFHLLTGDETLPSFMETVEQARSLLQREAELISWQEAVQLVNEAAKF